jgi:beta-glucosidase
VRSRSSRSGFGLSYADFRLSHLRVTPVLGRRGQVHVEVDVTNTGSRSGAEVVQLYLTFPPAAGEPPHQLKRFDKIDLRPGERRRVQFTLDQRAFSVWDAAAQRWTTGAGYQVAAGTSSRDLPLSAPVTVLFAGP